MSHVRIVLVSLLGAILVAGAGCGATATSGAGACQPVNNWGGPIFACGGGGSSASSDDQPSAEGNGDTEANNTETTDNTPGQGNTPEATPEPEPAVSVDGSTISTRDPIEFESGKATVTSESQATLEAVAKYLEDNPDITVVNINVAPENKGKKDVKLAKKRASEVRKRLTKAGVAGKRLKAKGLKEPSGDRMVELEVAKRK